MSFITKRERVFNEHDLYDLPSRNEGKLKAYSSCTDARAWSHFCSDKTEHLFEIIKKNNETCRPKYIPTDVIVNTLMGAKNAEIGRLKRKIEEFEQMIAAYDQLELTCEQKCDIANAHAAIKAANKELDEMCLDLDLSGFTEGVDSEAFETGKSRGDEITRSIGDETAKSKGDELEKTRAEDCRFNKTPSTKLVSKSNQVGSGALSCPCDASTSAYDTRIDDMQETIIRKDAKLNAMQNRIAVMEMDVCEPYCIYVHIYTELEKIFGTLCQNAKYKQYLNLLTAGRDTRCIDIKGKILFKMKVLEKFCLALIAPCSQDFNEKHSIQDCTCYRAEIVAKLETTLALTSTESHRDNVDNRRAQLVADIIHNDEMNEILSKQSLVGTNDNEQQRDDNYGLDSCSTDTESLNRLKNLQANYEELLTCYENLKHEKDCLFLRCQNYFDLEKECEGLQNRLREYKQLWNEKEYFRKRSEDLDALKESYYVLSEETTDLEGKLKAEIEINKIKSSNIARLQDENVCLEKKLQDLSLTFEKEKYSLICKLQKYECTVMCQEQQIKTLSQQIDKFLEQGHDDIQSEEATRSIELLNEIESQKEQIRNLREALLCNEEEKQLLQQDFQMKLQLINELKTEIENLKDKSEKLLQTNTCLEECTRGYQKEIKYLRKQNEDLILQIESKTQDLVNLDDKVKRTSAEIDSLTNIINKKSSENMQLSEELNKTQEIYSRTITSINDVNKIAIDSLKSAQRKSHEILAKFRSYIQTNDQNLIKLEADGQIRVEADDMESKSSNSSVLLNEINKLHELSIHSLHSLLDENLRIKETIDISKKESLMLESKVQKFDELNHKLDELQNSYDKLLEEKNELQNELDMKRNELDSLIYSFKLTKKESYELMERLNQTENIKGEYVKLNSLYQTLVNDRELMKHELQNRTKEIDNLSQTLKNIHDDNEKLHSENERLLSCKKELEQLNKSFMDITNEKNQLQRMYEEKMEEIEILHNKLEVQINENKDLFYKIEQLNDKENLSQHRISSLKDENANIINDLILEKKESSIIVQKFESEIKSLKDAYYSVQLEKENLTNQLDQVHRRLQEVDEKNKQLHNENRELIMQSEDLEKALTQARKLINEHSSTPQEFLDSIKEEIETMKKEKILHRNHIRELSDKLDEADSIILDLKEDIAVRDNRIATLQNYVNGLEEEVRRLNDNIAVAVESSEQIIDNSHKRIDDSLKLIDAHHSKATHNMKMELIKLQNDNSILQNELSSTKNKTEEISEEKRKYLSEIRDLHDDRDVTLQNIKDLEILCTGDSSLSVNSCTINEVLHSLNKIRKCIEAKSTKSNSLEQTLLSVQNSSRLLLSKADEAKRIAESEKQKIISEKEDAIKERMTMEKQLAELETKLEEQIIKDQEIIKNLEGKLLNQKLMFEKINESSQNYVNKLENEILNLKDLYEKSLFKINEIQEKAFSAEEENTTKQEEIDIVTKNLEKKSKEVTFLRKCLEDIKNTPLKNTDTQTLDQLNIKDNSCQTDFIKLNDNGEVNNFFTNDKSTYGNEQTNQIELDEIKQIDMSESLNFEFIKHIYLNYKVQKLSPTILEHCSISCTNIDESINGNKPISEVESPHKITVMEAEIQNRNQTNHNMIIDIYNTQSIFTHNTELSSRSPGVESPIELNSDILARNNGKANNFTKERKLNVHRTQSSDNDLFLIYKDSDGNHTDFDKKLSWENQKKSEAITVSSFVHNNMKNITENIETPSHRDKKTKYYMDVSGLQDDDSVKPKLTVSLPRVYTDSVSPATNSTSKNSKNSYMPSSRGSLKLSLSDININNINKSSKHKKVTNFDKLKQEDPVSKVNVLDTLTLVRQSPKKHKNSEHIKRRHMEDHKKRSDPSEKNHHLLKHDNKIQKVLRDDKNIKTNYTEKNKSKDSIDRQNIRKQSSNYALKYILDSVQQTVNVNNFKLRRGDLTRSHSDNNLIFSKDSVSKQSDSRSLSPLLRSSTNGYRTSLTNENDVSKTSKIGRSVVSMEQGVLAKLDNIQEYENKIEELNRTLDNIEKHYKMKIEAVKAQYDNNIKHIITEHNQGVVSIQSLHEETLTDVKRSHENEIENLRSMSIDAMRKADILERENMMYKLKLQEQYPIVKAEESMKTLPLDVRKRKHRSDSKMLTATNIEAFNVRPKPRSHGPCTCTLDTNISDTIRNIFEQVDVDQRKMAEGAYVKYIANKIMSHNVEALDAEELAFLHLKVCRTWKTMLTKQEAWQKHVVSLEHELLNKQRQTQKNIAELDRKVAEERQRLQEVREAVCRNTPANSRDVSPQTQPAVPEKDECRCCTSGNYPIEERLSAGDLPLALAASTIRPKRLKQESNRAVTAKLDDKERRDRKHYHDEQPIRLRRSHDRTMKSCHRK